MSPLNVEIMELRRRLYGGELPGETGDIPMMRDDIASIKASVDDLAGFYRTLIRLVQVTGGIAALGAAVATILDLAHVI